MNYLPLAYLHRIRKSLENMQTFRRPPGIEKKVTEGSMMEALCESPERTPQHEATQVFRSAELRIRSSG